MQENLCVIVPSRGRPANIGRLIDSWAATAANAHLLVVLDDDDPSFPDYVDVIDAADGDPALLDVIVGERIRLGPTLNREAAQIARDWSYLGFMGDDHNPETNCWDERVTDHLADMGTGFVYCNDLFQKSNLPTAVFMTSDIVQKLGYMCPPELVHMYLDNAWLDWGNGIDRLRYLPDVIIEHLHPEAGKAEDDERYAEVRPAMGPDSIAYAQYKLDQFPRDIDKLKGLL
jgi:hypothetical protein